MNTLKITREKCQLTQRELATRIGIPEQQYQLYEYSRRTPNVYIAIRMAKALGTTVEQLFIDDCDTKEL